MSGSTVAMTIRLPASQAAALSTVATVDGLPAAEVIRIAIDEHIALRRKDETFQENLRRHIEQESSLLAVGSSLAGPHGRCSGSSPPHQWPPHRSRGTSGRQLGRSLSLSRSSLALPPVSGCGGLAASWTTGSRRRGSVRDHHHRRDRRGAGGRRRCAGSRHAGHSRTGLRDRAPEAAGWRPVPREQCDQDDGGPRKCCGTRQLGPHRGDCPKSASVQDAMLDHEEMYRHKAEVPRDHH